MEFRLAPQQSCKRGFVRIIYFITIYCVEPIVTPRFVKEKVLEGDPLTVSSSKFEVAILDEYALSMFVLDVMNDSKVRTQFADPTP